MSRSLLVFGNLCVRSPMFKSHANGNSFANGNGFGLKPGAVAAAEFTHWTLSLGIPPGIYAS
jgi:hypothetical protein